MGYLSSRGAAMVFVRRVGNSVPGVRAYPTGNGGGSEPSDKRNISGGGGKEYSSADDGRGGYSRGGASGTID